MSAAFCMGREIALPYALRRVELAQEHLDYWANFEVMSRGMSFEMRAAAWRGYLVALEMLFDALASLGEVS